MSKDIVEPDSTALVRGAQTRGEVVQMRNEPVSIRDNTFAKSGTKALSKAADRVLRAAVHPSKEVDILTTGEIYMSHVFVRRRLNNAVGSMGWALRPISEINTTSAENTMFREYALIVHGRVVATAFGSAKYYPKNARMDFADTAEAVKSNALTRCCKDLGIGSECWDRQYCDEWRDKYAVHVWAVESTWDRDKRQQVKKTVDRWRRYTAKPLHGEFDIVRDSPNQDKWRAQYERWIAMLETESAQSKVVSDRMQKVRREIRDQRKAEQPEPSEPETAEGGEQAAETRAPEPPIDVAASRPANGPTAHTGSNGVAADDRPFLVRECKIAEKTPNFTLHRITMMNNAVYFTFSSRVYAEFQRYFASREKVQIYAKDQLSKDNKKYPHIDEWKDIKTGAKKK